MRLNFPFYISSILLIFLSIQGLKAQDKKPGKIGIASYYHGWLDGKTTANGEKYDESLMTAAHPSLPFNSKVKVTNLKNLKSIIVRINDRGPFVNKRIIDLSRAAADSLDFIYNGLAKVQLTILSYGKPNDAQHQQLIASAKSIRKPVEMVIKTPIIIKEITKTTKPIENIKVEMHKKIIIPETKMMENKPLAENTAYGLQIGSFKVKNNAVQLSEKMKIKYNEEINIQEIKKGNTSFFRLIIGKFADEKKAIQLKEKLNKVYPESFIIRH